MHYLSLRDLEKQLGFSFDLSTDELRDNFIRKVDAISEKGSIHISEKTYPFEDVRSFLLSLDSNKIVYLDWIEQHKDLKTLLLGITPAHEFIDAFKWKEHALFAEFSHFLSSFLSPELLFYKDEHSLEKLHRVFSYCPLLPKDERTVVEQLMFKTQKEKITALQPKLAEAKSEKELTTLLQEFCNDDLIGIVNLLSRSSYASKVWYVDQLLSVIQQQACTVRLANWILKQLEKIVLNPEHLERITDLKKELSKGKIRVKNSNLSKQRGLSLKTIFGFAFVTLLIGFSTWIILKKPFSTPKEDLFQTSTAYEQFTKEERKKIDSLLREIQKENSPQSNEIDTHQPLMGSGISMSIRVPFSNSRMERLYQDLLIDAELQEKGLIDTCTVFTELKISKTTYNGVTSAKSRKASVSLLLKNESAYDCYIFNFEEKKGGKIYSTILKKGTSTEIKMNPKEYVLFVPGNDLGQFIAPKNASELPSADFDHHFCTVDMNYGEALLNLYTLENPGSGKNKLLISGDLKGYFSVIDLYGVLELK